MIIENLIPIEKQDELEKICTSDVFPWYFNSTTVNDNQDSGFQFIHRVFDDGKVISDLFPKLVQIMDNFQEKSGLKIKEIVRIKANLLTPVTLADHTLLNTFHSDIESITDTDHISLVYYVTKSDGDTIILNNMSVSPVKGRACYFNSTLMHRASNPVNYNRRIILNFVLRVK
jgi:hypothetical protein